MMLGQYEENDHNFHMENPTKQRVQSYNCKFLCIRDMINKVHKHHTRIKHYYPLKIILDVCLETFFWDLFAAFYFWDLFAAFYFCVITV